MSKPYFRPQIVIQQEFAPLAGTIVQPQNVLLVGPIYKVLEADDAADLLSINYGAYDPTQDTDYDYAGRPTGGVVDQASVKLIMRDVFAQYAQLSGANVIERGAAANEITIPTANGFQNFNNGTTQFNRNAVFVNRDVAVGDRVRVVSGAVDFKSRVIGFKNAVVDAIVAAANNTNSQATQAHAITPATVNAQGTDHIFAGAGTYLGSLSAGVIADLYTLTCTVAGAGGVRQVETATAAGSVTADGNASVTVTAAGLTGSPLVLAVPVVNGDTAAVWAGKVRTALSGTAAITALFSVGGAGTSIVLTRLIGAANDATLNIALATGTATGITAAPTSADTTAGVESTARFSVQSTTGDNTAEISIIFGLAFSVGTRGAQASITSAGSQAFVVGEQYTLTVASNYAKITPTRTSSASTYDGLFDAVYTVKVVKGGTWAEEPQVVVTTNNGTDAAAAITVAEATNFLVGTLGITASIASNAQGGLLLNDTFTIAATAAKKGAVRTALIANPIPAAILAGDDLSVTFYIYKSEIEIPAKGYPTFPDVALTTDDDNFTVAAGIAILDSTWTDGGGSPDPILVKFATLVVPYRVLLTADANDTHSLSDLASVELVLGKVVPENPMAYAMDKALQNSGNQTVFYIPISSDDIEGYRLALGAHETDQQGYMIVPLSEDRAIRDLVDAHVQNMSSGSETAPGPKRCIAFVPSIIDEITTKYGVKENGENWTGFVWEDPENAGEFTYVTVPGATFLTDGIRPTDIFRSDYGVDSFGNDTYVAKEIDAVIDEETLVLRSPGFSAAVGDALNLQRVSIVRNLSYDEQAQAAESDSESLKSRRIYSVFPDFPIQVAWFHLAAAVAGLASSVAPHQPITNASLNGFNDQDGPRKRFTPTQMDTMAQGGTLIVTRPKSGGETFIRHQLSTDNTDDNRSELSVTRNLDSISDALEADLRQFIGKYNATEHLLQLVDTITRQKFSFFITETRTITAGPQLIAYDEASLKVEINSVARTQVDVEADLELPLPVNRIRVRLRVTTLQA